jgi:hypothetical protein
MAKLDVYEPLLAPSDVQPVVAGLWIMQQMCGLVNHDVAIGVVGFVSGPCHVRIVSREAIASHLDIVRLEPMISEQSPENLPR